MPHIDPPNTPSPDSDTITGDNGVEKTIHHAACGAILPVHGAVLEEGTTWCSGCNTIFTATEHTLETQPV